MQVPAPGVRVTVYVGIDPGVHACGIAASDKYAMLGALWARTDTKDALAEDVAEAALRGLRLAVQSRPSVRNDELVIGIEFPEVTRDRARGEAKTEDLLDLSFAVGRVFEHLKTKLPGAHLLRLQVSTWKHNVKTEVLAKRLLGMVPPMGLSLAETKNVTWPADSYRHNVVDAIAISRWLRDWPARNPSKNLKDFARL